MKIEKTIDPSQYKQGMRRLASGIAIVATTFENKYYGLIVTAVTSVSASPPTLLISVSRSTFAHDFISRSGNFSVNILHEDDRSIAENFANPELRLERFNFGQWSTSLTGAPILESAIVSFDCSIVQKTPISSHTVFFGEVMQVHLREGEVNPLLYWNGEYRAGRAKH